MIKRRTLLLGGAGVLALAGLGVVGADATARIEIAAIVRRRLSYLTLDDAGVRAFAHDQVDAWLAKRPTWKRIQYHFMSVFAKSFTRFQRSDDRRTRLQRIEDSFVLNYLMSTDFFINHADETRTIQYLGLYDPLRACGNPFARPALDPAAAA